jgi:hypothetical protein
MFWFFFGSSGSSDFFSFQSDHSVFRIGFFWFFRDHLCASTIQRCKAFHAYHKLFDRDDETFDFRDKKTVKWNFKRRLFQAAAKFKAQIPELMVAKCVTPEAKK